MQTLPADLTIISLLPWSLVSPHVRDRHSLLCVIFALSEFYYVQSKISLSSSFVPSVSLACSMCELGSLGFL